MDQIVRADVTTGKSFSCFGILHQNTTTKFVLGERNIGDTNVSFLFFSSQSTGNVNMINWF